MSLPINDLGLSISDKRQSGGTDRSSFAARISRLLASIPTMELARRTGVGHASVVKYRQGRRIPVAFLAALVRNCNVNPSWILHGTGKPFLQEELRDNNRLQADSLALVEALISTLRVQIASIDERKGLRRLARLRDSMTRFRELKARLDTLTLPRVNWIIEQYATRVYGRDLLAAKAFEALSLKLCLLCDHAELRQQVYDVQGAAYYHAGEFETALRVWGSLLVDLAVRFQAWEKKRITLTSNIALGWFGQHRPFEALRAARVGLALARRDPATPTAPLASLRFIAASMELETEGDARGAVRALARAYPCLDTRHQGGFRSNYLHGLLLNGCIRLDEAIVIATRRFETLLQSGRINLASTLLSHAILREDFTAIRAINQSVISRSGKYEDQRLEFVESYAHALQAILADRDSAALGRFRESAVNLSAAGDTKHALHFATSTFACQGFRLLGARDQALSELDIAQYKLGKLSPSIVERLLWRAIHYRNALALLQAPVNTCSEQRHTLLADAKCFFAHHDRLGFRGLRLGGTHSERSAPMVIHSSAI